MIKINPVFRGTNFKTKLLQKLRLVKTVLLLSFFLDDPVLITCEWSKLLLPSCPPQDSFWQFHTNIPVQPELGKYCKHHRVGIYCSPPSVLQQVFWASIVTERTYGDHGMTYDQQLSYLYINSVKSVNNINVGSLFKHPKNWETALWGKERLYWKKGFRGRS